MANFIDRASIGKVQQVSPDPVLQQNRNQGLKEEVPKNLQESANKVREFVGFFYKIKDPQNKTIGNLCGLKHFCEGSLFKLSGPINKAIYKSDTIFLENKNPPKILEDRRKMIYKLIQDENPDIIALAVSRYEHEIHRRANDFGWEAIKSKCRFDHLSPFEKFELCRKHYDVIMALELGKNDEEISIQGMDDFIYSISKVLGKNIYGLETSVDISELEVATFSKSLFLHPDFDKEKRGYTSGSKEWLTGKIEVPPNVKENPSSEEEQLYWNMTCGRTEKFSRIIMNHLRRGQGRAFYAFGFSHLYNQRSVIRSLQAKGFKIVRY